VTIVDASTGKSVEMIGGGGYALRLLGGGALAVVSGGKLQILDTERNLKADELELPDIRGLAVAPDGAQAVVLAKRLVLCLDGGKVLARLTDFASPRDVVFE